MKKIISFILIQATLLMLPVHSLVQYYSFDTGIVDLSEKSNDDVSVIRTRKQIDGLRMYVDEENPHGFLRSYGSVISVYVI